MITGQTKSSRHDVDVGDILELVVYEKFSKNNLKEFTNSLRLRGSYERTNGK